MIKPCLYFFLLLIFCGFNSLQAQSYTDVASQNNITFTNSTLTAQGGGVSFVDFDGDGWDDISLGTGLFDSVVFYRNNGGNGFSRDPLSGISFTGESQQIIWVDYDNDGDKDLYISANLNANKLYRNDQPNGFTDVTASAGLSGAVTETYGACWGDINNDGYLDLYEVNQLNFGGGHNKLYLNNGAGGFTDISVSSNTQDSIRYSFIPAFVDYDKDGLQDIFIANDRSDETTLLRNMGDSTFQDVSNQTGVNVAMDGMSATIGDYDNNGWLDIYVTDTYHNRLFANMGGGNFIEISDSMEVEFGNETWSALFIDSDLDGDLDLHVCSVVIGQGAANTFFENIDTVFSNSSPIAGDTLKNFASAMGDFNNDGFPDIVSPNRFPTSLQLWKNSATGTNNYVKVQLEGVISNRDGIGSWIEVYANGNLYTRYTHAGYGYLGQNSLSTIIGIGSATQVDSMVITWLSGHKDRFYQLGVNQKYNIQEGSSVVADLVVTGDTIFCQGDSINTVLSLTNTFDYYLWSNGDTTATLNVTMPGTYSVVAGINSGFSDTSVSVSIFVDSISLNAYAISDTDNQGVGSASVNIVGGVPPYQYSWNDSLSQVTATATNLKTGTYRVLVTDSLGCMDSIQIVVPNQVTSDLSEFTSRNFEAFPNPATDAVYLNFKGEGYPGFSSCLVQLLDARSGIIMELNWNIADQVTIPTGRIGSGLYFIRIIPQSADSPEAVISFSKI